MSMSFSTILYYENKSSNIPIFLKRLAGYLVSLWHTSYFKPIFFLCQTWAWTANWNRWLTLTYKRNNNNNFLYIFANMVTNSACREPRTLNVVLSVEGSVVYLKASLSYRRAWRCCHVFQYLGFYLIFEDSHKKGMFLRYKNLIETNFL